MKNYLFLLSPLLLLQLSLQAAESKLSPGQADFLNLHDAIKRDDIKAVKEYFSSHPEEAKFLRPLHLATQFSRPKLVQQLLASGSSVNELALKLPAIAYATKPEIAQILLDAGADPSITFGFIDNDKRTKGTVLDYLNKQINDWKDVKGDWAQRKLDNFIKTKEVIENYIKNKSQAKPTSTSNGKAEIA